MDFDGVLFAGVLGLVLPQMTLASSFLHSRQMVEVEAVPEPTFSLAALASDRVRVLERLKLEAASALTGLAMRDILWPAEKILNEEMKSDNFP